MAVNFKTAKIPVSKKFRQAVKETTNKIGDKSHKNLLISVYLMRQKIKGLLPIYLVHKFVKRKRI